MNRVKKLVALIVAILCLVIMQACDTADKDNNTVATASNGEPYIPNADPEPLEGYDTSFNGFSNMLGIYNETEYTEIVVEPEKKVYSLSADSVFSCTIKNNHVGHGFYIYGAVYIDKLIDGVWVRQCNKYAVESAQHLQWLYIGIEGNKAGIQSTKEGIAVDDILPAVTPGRYRIVVFTPKDTHYAEFDVQA